MPSEAVAHTTIHADLKTAIRCAIEDGGWKQGFRLPGERELVEKYRCARMTVRRALKDLEVEGLIVRRHGAGTFVADLRPISNVLTVKDIHEEIIERGHKHTSTKLSSKAIKAGATIAEAMQIVSGSAVFSCEVIHYENGVPIQFEERFVNPAVVPDFLALDLQTHTASSYLFERAPLTAAEQVVEAVNADAAIAGHLNVAPGAALLRVSRRTMSHGNVASIARLYHPGYVYRLIGTFTTKS